MVVGVPALGGASEEEECSHAARRLRSRARGSARPAPQEGRVQRQEGPAGLDVDARPGEGRSSRRHRARRRREARRGRHPHVRREGRPRRERRQGEAPRARPARRPRGSPPRGRRRPRDGRLPLHQVHDRRSQAEGGARAGHDLPLLGDVPKDAKAARRPRPDRRLRREPRARPLERAAERPLPRDASPRPRQAMAKEAGLKVQVFDFKEIQKRGMRLLQAVGQGSERKPCMVHFSHVPAGSGAAGRRAHRVRRQGHHVRLRRPLHQAGRRHGRDEARHERRGERRRPHADRRRASSRTSRCTASSPRPRTCPTAAPIAPATCGARSTARASRSSTPTPKAASSSPTRSRTRATLEPTLLVDNATLTGACVVALGNSCSGWYASNDATAEEFQGSGEGQRRADVAHAARSRTSSEQLKSDSADLKHTGDRWGGSITRRALPPRVHRHRPELGPLRHRRPGDGRPRPRLGSRRAAPATACSRSSIVDRARGAQRGGGSRLRAAPAPAKPAAVAKAPAAKAPAAKAPAAKLRRRRLRPRRPGGEGPAQGSGSEGPAAKPARRRRRESPRQRRLRQRSRREEAGAPQVAASQLNERWQRRDVPTSRRFRFWAPAVRCRSREPSACPPETELLPSSARWTIPLSSVASRAPCRAP